jgi:hypothetical protein
VAPNPHFPFGMKLKLGNPNSILFVAIIVLKILDVATTYYAVRYLGAEELNPLAGYINTTPEYMLLRFAFMVSILYFSQPIILGMASSRERRLVRTLLVVLNNLFQIVRALGWAYRIFLSERSLEDPDCAAVNPADDLGLSSILFGSENPSLT